MAKERTKEEIIIELIEDHFSEHGAMTTEDWDNILIEAEREKERN